MAELMRFSASPTVPYAGKILFLAKMSRVYQDKVNPALAYMGPILQRSGYSIAVSDISAFPRNGIYYDRGEIEKRLARLDEQIMAEKPDCVAMSVFDANLPFVHEASHLFGRMEQAPALALGGPFITINPADSLQLFRQAGSLIMVNGEGEVAFPEALRIFMERSQSDRDGIFVKRDQLQYTNNFLMRTSLTAEEHEALVPNLDVFTGIDAQSGFDIHTSRGCFEGCSICVASRVFRSGHVSWSYEHRRAVIFLADQWLRDHGAIGKTWVGFSDDNLLYGVQGREFFRKFSADSLSQTVNILPQFSLSGLFDADGRFRDEIPASMLHPDGTPFVSRVTVGIDYWAVGERARNKGPKQGLLSNQQIRQAIKAFTDRGIIFSAYWMLGDEQTTLSSFVESLVFLSELMIDFGPYFFVNTGEPVELRTGTSIRQRVLQARNALPEGYLSPMCTVTEGQTSVELFQWLFPRPSLITQAYMLLSRAIFSRDQRMHATPVQVLWGMLSIVMHWRGDILNVRARNLVDLAVKKMSAGIPVSRVIELIPELKNLPTDFPFLGGIQSCVLEELLEMLYLSKKIPRYYLRQNRSEYDAQFERRNPRFAEKQAAMLANGREI